MPISHKKNALAILNMQMTFNAFWSLINTEVLLLTQDMFSLTFVGAGCCTLHFTRHSNKLVACQKCRAVSAVNFLPL